MSTNYSALHGIGFQIVPTNKIPKEDLEDGFEEYLGSVELKALEIDIEFFTVNSEYVSDGSCSYAVLRDPFRFGLDLSHRKLILEEVLTRLNFDIVSEFGLVGGLNVSY